LDEKSDKTLFLELKKGIGKEGYSIAAEKLYGITYKARPISLPIIEDVWSTSYLRENGDPLGLFYGTSFHAPVSEVGPG